MSINIPVEGMTGTSPLISGGADSTGVSPAMTPGYSVGVTGSPIPSVAVGGSPMPVAASAPLSASEKSELVRHTLNSLRSQRLRVPVADLFFALAVAFYQLMIMVQFICDKKEVDNPSYYQTGNWCDYRKESRAFMGIAVLTMVCGLFKAVLELIYQKDVKSKLAEAIFGLGALFWGIWAVTVSKCDESGNCNLSKEFSSLIALTAVSLVCFLTKAFLSLCQTSDALSMPNNSAIFVQQTVQTFRGTGTNGTVVAYQQYQPIQQFQPVQQYQQVAVPVQGMQMQPMQPMYVVPAQQNPAFH